MDKLVILCIVFLSIAVALLVVNLILVICGVGASLIISLISGAFCGATMLCLGLIGLKN